MYWDLPALWWALALIPVVTSKPGAQDDTAHPRRMLPIHVRDYELSFGIQRRATEQFSSLDLQTQSQLIYGSPLENQQLLLANMTLYAPDGLQMVLLEEFDGLTSSVNCKGEDGMMSLTFKSQDAFNYALKTWNFINEKEDSKFLVIANHDGCGPNDQRQPYLISNIREDPTTLTTYLTAQIAPWSDVAGTYDMDFGKAIPFQRPSQLQTRGLWGDITGAVSGAFNDVKSVAGDVVNGVESVATKVESVATTVATDVANVAGDIGNALTGTVDMSKSVSFGMNAGTPNQKTQIFSDNTHLILDCINCYIAGSVEVTGHISVDHFSLKDLSLDGTPHGLNGALEMEAQITKYEMPDSLKYVKELFSAPVPDAGIEVPGIFKIGAILSYEVGIGASFQGSATIDFGLAMNVPDSAGLHVDIMSPGASTAQGFSGDITPIFDIKALSASISTSVYAQPKLSFGVELTEIGTVDIALTFKMPSLGVKFSAAYNESGLCSHGPGASQTGVEITSQVGLELDLQIDASLGAESTMKPSYWMKLWSDYHVLSSACWPLAIPGLAVPSNSLTALPAQPSATGNGSDIPVANFSLLTGSAYSTYVIPSSLLPSGAPSAAPLTGNASNVAVPTGFLKSHTSGAAPSTGVFSTGGAASSKGFPYPIHARPWPSNSTSNLPSGSAFQTMPSYTGTATGGVNPPKPTGSPPIPSVGSVGSSGGVHSSIPTGPTPTLPTGTVASASWIDRHSRRPSGLSTQHRAHTLKTKSTKTRGSHTKTTYTEAPYPTNTESAGGSRAGGAESTGAARASNHRSRYSV